MTQDPVQQALLDLIASKQKAGKRGQKKGSSTKSANVVDLMADLKKSLQGGLQD